MCFAGDRAGELEPSRSAPAVSGGWESSVDLEARRIRLYQEEGSKESFSGREEALSK